MRKHSQKFKQQQKQKHAQRGRSMIEILGVLAIICLLSMGEL